MAAGDHAKVKRLLEDDQALLKYVYEQLEYNVSRLNWMMVTLKRIQSFHAVLELRHPSFADVYAEAMSGDFYKSRMARELLLRAKLCSPDTLTTLITDVRDSLLSMPPSNISLSPDHFEELEEQLPPFVANSGETSKSKKQWSELRQSCCESVASYIEQTICASEDFFLHEILFYDLSAPHRDAFNPRVRMAVERALSSPQDYLGCSCCANTKVSALSECML